MVCRTDNVCLCARRGAVKEAVGAIIECVPLNVEYSSHTLLLLPNDGSVVCIEVSLCLNVVIGVLNISQ